MSPLKWMGSLLMAFGVAFAGEAAWGNIDEPTRLLQPAASLKGSSGWMVVPTAAVVPSGFLAAAIHQAEAKVSLGVFDVFEGGFYFRTNEITDDFEKYRDLSDWEKVKRNVPDFLQDAFRSQAKLKVLDQSWGWINLAVGWQHDAAYAVVHRFFPELSRATLTFGWGQGRFERGFGGVSKTIMPGAEFAFEYDGEGLNTGLRMLLAKRLILTLGIRRLDTLGQVRSLGEVVGDHLVFGITYLEPLW